MSKKSLNDYKKVGEKRGIIYLLECIPRNTRVKVEGWKCSNDHIWSARYNDIQQGTGCPHCSGLLPKNLNDYNNLAKLKGFKYIQDNVPKSVDTSINGWKCSNDHIWKATYSNIQHSTGCPHCSGQFPKNLEDYKKLAQGKGFTYTLNDIPKSIKILTDGWKCSNDHNWSARYDDIRSGYACPYCSSLRSESLCRDIFETSLSTQFIKIYPKFLQGLQYDGYNEKMKLAWEYMGRQHYEYVPHFHRNGEGDLQKQQERDTRKVNLSLQEGIKLIIIPYTYNYRKPNQLKEYIELQLLNIGFEISLNYFLTKI